MGKPVRLSTELSIGCPAAPDPLNLVDDVIISKYLLGI